MLRNLQAEMVKAGMSSKTLSKRAGISYNAFRRKVNGSVDFTVSQALFIWENFFPHVEFKELFKRF